MGYLFMIFDITVSVLVSDDKTVFLMVFVVFFDVILQRKAEKKNSTKVKQITKAGDPRYEVMSQHCS